jgi:hypothetical protein
MTEAQTKLLPADPAQEAQLRAKVVEWLRKILHANQQPAATELLEQVAENFGWEARIVLKEAVRSLEQDTHLQRYLRDYLRTTLSQEAFDEAFLDEGKQKREFQSTVDDLLRKSAICRSSKAFQDAIDFIARFREYAPYNNMLVKLQNPNCQFYATQKHWGVEFCRTVKEDARPMLILAPMHPVMLVYDLDQTEGPDLPEHFCNFGQAKGSWDPRRLGFLLENAERDLIQVQFKPLSSTRAGFATTRLRHERFKMRVVVHSEMDEPSRFSVLCHELAHIYLGHLGADRDGWWPCRTNLTHSTVEIEAESTAYIVCTRANLEADSTRYLASYVRGNGLPASVSLDLVTKIAGRLDEMSSRVLPRRRIREVATKG